MRLFQTLLLCLSLVLSSSVWSALIEQDLISGGDKLVTYDDSTGLEWLDMTATQGLGYSTVMASSYVTTYGFRYATLTELQGLYTGVGLDAVPLASKVSRLQAGAAELISKMGYLSSDAWHYSHIGRIAPVINGTDMEVYRVIQYTGGPYAGTGYQDNWTLANIETTHSHYGSYLVRGGASASVNAPGAALLFLLGGMAMRRRLRL
ncbi:MAG: hypothetical protein ACPG4N_02625 [Gammaproteobacteria bacterium]